MNSNALVDGKRDFQEAQRRSFTTLDGLRGIAAIAVVARHAPFLWGEHGPTGALSESYLAVDFFFVLSGFVLAHAYGSRFQHGLSNAAFMRTRLLRLYPLYLLALVFSSGVVAIQIGVGKADPRAAAVDAPVVAGAAAGEGAFSPASVNASMRLGVTVHESLLPRSMEFLPIR